MKHSLKVAMLVGVTAQVSLAGPPIPLVPGAPTGRSNIEQRYVYGQPDEGEFEFDLILGGAAPRELSVAEPSMCNGSARATVKYSKARNTVDVILDFHGLPYRPSFTRAEDVSTPYNQFPTSVENGVWQMWFVGRLLNFDTTFYYDPMTLQLIGSQYDVPNPPAYAIAIPAPTLHMIAGKLFEGTPGGQARVHQRFAYDGMLDEQGKGGVYFSYVPYNLCTPDAYGPYYTQGGLPLSKKLNFDQVLESIHQGYGMAIATSVEPRVKPAYLLSRDNTMIGWGGGYPGIIPAGIGVDPINGVYTRATSCQTHEMPRYAAPHYNLCSGS